jgi:dipeptidyl aminopeptidase/acylaminoacyl peptidase
MKAAGAHQVQIGLESGDQGQLDNMDKACTVESNARAIDLCRKHGLTTVASLIVGLPGETHDTLARTLDFLRSHPPDFFFLAPFSTRATGVPMLSAENRARFELQTVDHLRTGAPYWRHRTMSSVEMGNHLRDLHRTIMSEGISLHAAVYHHRLLDYRPDERAALLEEQRKIKIFALSIWRQKERVMEAGAPGAGPRISPDGRSIAYAIPEMSIRDLGPSPNIRRVSIRGLIGRPSWSPDGNRIRIVVHDPVSETSVFLDVHRDGSDLQPLPFRSEPGYGFRDGGWTADGRYFIYTSGRTDHSDSNLWILRENPAFGQGQPVRLTNGPVNFESLAPGSDASTIFALGVDFNSELARYDSQRREFVPYWNGVPAVDVAFSKDGGRAAYRRLPDDTLWVSRSDGSEARQLTQPPLEADQPHWSPDGARIAFMGRNLSSEPRAVYPRQSNRMMLSTRVFLRGPPMANTSYSASCVNGSRIARCSSTCSISPAEQRPSSRTPGASGRRAGRRTVGISSPRPQTSSR